MKPLVDPINYPLVNDDITGWNIPIFTRKFRVFNPGPSYSQLCYPRNPVTFSDDEQGVSFITSETKGIRFHETILRFGDWIPRDLTTFS